MYACVCVYINGKASRDEHNLPCNNRKNRARIISGYVRPRFRPLFSFIHWTGFPLKTLNAQNGNLRGRRVTYYRIKYTVVADLSLPVCGAGTTYPPPPPLSSRPFRATKHHDPIVQGPFGGRFRTWFVIEFQPLAEDEVQKARWKPRASTVTL